MMQKIFIYGLKSFKYLKAIILKRTDWAFTYVKFYANGIQHSSFKTFGIPHVNISLGGKTVIGENFRLNNTITSNPIGRVSTSSLIVGDKGVLTIGNNVGMSSCTLVCHHAITIHSNVKLGGNVVVYDTDFHSLQNAHRTNTSIDKSNTKTKPIVIGENAFIGGHSTILKGVIIGKNAIIGACSLVTKNIPDNQIWAGNPATFIKNI